MIIYLDICLVSLSSDYLNQMMIFKTELSFVFNTTQHVVKNIHIGFLHKIKDMNDAFDVQFHAFGEKNGCLFCTKT